MIVYKFFRDRLSSHEGHLRMVVLSPRARREVQEHHRRPRAGLYGVYRYSLTYTMTHLRVGAFTLSVYHAPVTYSERRI